jgi:hypothetical protein
MFIILYIFYNYILGDTRLPGQTASVGTFDNTTASCTSASTMVSQAQGATPTAGGDNNYNNNNNEIIFFFEINNLGAGAFLRKVGSGGVEAVGEGEHRGK